MHARGRTIVPGVGLEEVIHVHHPARAAVAALRAVAVGKTGLDGREALGEGSQRFDGSNAHAVHGT